MEILKEKSLVIQTAFIGDAVLTLPMIQVLSQQHNALVDVVCIPSTEIIFKNSPYVNEVIVLEKRGKHKSLFSLRKFAKELKMNRYSRIYSPHRSFRTSLLVLLTGVRETYGFTENSMRHVYKHLVEYHTNHHEVQRNLDLIGYKEDDWRILPELKTHISPLVNEILAKLNQNIKVAIAPGSVWNTKVYPVEYYKEIIAYLMQKNYSVVLLGGEADKKICEELKIDDKVVDTSGTLNIMESITLLKSIDLLICNDSAPTHFGMAADIKVLTLYCSTVPDFGFYPYNKQSSYLSYNDLFCKPCGIHGYDQCPIKTFECALKLNSELVIKKIDEMII